MSLTRPSPLITTLVLAVAVMVGSMGAAAAQGGEVRVSPMSGGPGTQVQLYAQCATSAATANVTASSDAFLPSTFRLKANPGSYWYGSARVSGQASKGAHSITVQCGPDESLSGAFSVTGGYPTLAPNTGGGGLALVHQAAATPTPTPGWLLAGAAALVALVMAGTGLLLRSRRRCANQTA